MNYLSNLATASLLLLAAAPALAQQSGGMQGMDMTKGMSGMNMNDMDMKGMDMKGMAMHMMPATVTAVDVNTGLLDVSSEGMALKLHFPPAQLMDLKSGDKITLHLAFSKP